LGGIEKGSAGGMSALIGNKRSICKKCPRIWREGGRKGKWVCGVKRNESPYRYAYPFGDIFLVPKDCPFYVEHALVEQEDL